MMDPHSRLSQFNTRSPKSGPQAFNPRFATDTINISSPSSPSLSASKRPTTQPTSMALVVPSPPTKRSKSGSLRRPIATNSRIEQLQDDKMKKDMYLAFILDALDKMSKGDTAPFNDLLDQFNPQKQASASTSTTNPSQLRLWISSLTHVVSRLERVHAPLVSALVHMSWTTLDQATVRSYTVFIGMLVSARPEYLSMVLAMIAKGFTYHSGLKAVHLFSVSSSSKLPERRVVYERLHALLQHLLNLIPTLPSTLEPLLVANFPHKRQNYPAQVTYIRNLLQVSRYCPELAHVILGTVIDRAIQIDVEIQVEIEELEGLEDPTLADDSEVFTLDPFDTPIGEENDSDNEDHGDDEDIDDSMSDLSSSGGFDDSDDDATKELRTTSKYIQEMVRKLDAILELVFGYFKEGWEGLLPAGTGDVTQDGQADTPPLSALPALPELPPLDSPNLLTPTAHNPFYPFPTSISAPIPTFPQARTPLLEKSNLSHTSTPASTSPQTDKKLLKRKRANLLAQFHTLLSIFDRTILRTFKSRYTQFLVFWYTSLDREFSDIFQGMLVERALLESSEDGLGVGAAVGPVSAGGGLRAITPTVTRAAAASYIGSYVSRAEFVDGEETRAIVGVLCAFLGGHLDEIEEELRESGALLNGSSAAVNVLYGSTAQNTVWYAVVQAVFLIFCFRWRDLLVDEGGEGLDVGDVDVEALVGVGKKGGAGGKWLPGLSVLQRVVQSVLNPLKVCSPNVVNQFAKIAHTTNFLYCYTLLEANKRSDYSSDPNSSSASIHPAVLESAVNPELSTFFPFDPYRLPRSGKFIEKIYREWGSVAVGDEDEDSDEEDEEEDEEDELKADLGGYLSGPRSSSPVMIMGGRNEKDDEEDEELGQSLDKMNISPMHPALRARMEGV